MFLQKKEDIHSIMIVQHGNIIKEKWFGENSAEKSHAMHSVTKTVTATAVAMAVNEGLLKLDDKVISFFPEVFAQTLYHRICVSWKCVICLQCHQVVDDVDPTITPSSKIMTVAVYVVSSQLRWCISPVLILYITTSAVMFFRLYFRK